MYREMERSGDVITGAMLTVGAVRREAVLKLVEQSEGALHLALDNCFHQSVLFGSDSAMSAAAQQLRAQGGLCSYLSINRAYHTPEFEPVARAIEELNRQIDFGAADVPLYSCASHGLFPDDAEQSRRIAAMQWAARVRFTETVQQMYEDGCQIFVEVGPASNLTGFIGDILRHKDHLAVASNHRSRSDLLQIQNMLGQLFVHGCPLSLSYQFRGREVRQIDFQAEPPEPAKKPPILANTLPYVHFEEGEVQKLRALISPSGDVLPSEPEGSGDSAVAERLPADTGGTQLEESLGDEAYSENVVLGHFDLMRQFLSGQENVFEAAYAAEPVPCELPFLSRVIEHEEDSAVAEFDFDPDTQEFLQHHILYASQISDFDDGLYGLPVVPMSVSIEMLVEIASLIRSLPIVQAIENVRAYSWVELSDGPRTVRLSARRLEITQERETIYAAVHDGEVLLVDGEIVFAAEPGTLDDLLPPLSVPRSSSLAPDQLYTTGMFHGPMFQSVREISAWDEEGIDAVLADTPTVNFFSNGTIPQFVLNPVALDAVGQLAAFWILQSHGHDFSSFPSVIERIELFAAAEETTGGATLRGRLSFLESERQPKLVKGDFEAFDAGSLPLFRVRGWQDRFHPVPHRFFAARTNPREEWYGEDWSGLFAKLPLKTLVWCVPPFEPGFFEEAGGIFKHLIAQTVLNSEERLEWRALTGSRERRSEWLLGRIALKEAVRSWIAVWHEWLLFPADIWIRTDQAGKPFVDGPWLDDLIDVPQVSLAHADGYCIAAVGPADQSIGVDIEVIGRAEMQDVAGTAFTREEKQQIEACPAANRTELALRIWCAKEAAGKSLGSGLSGYPPGISIEPLGTDGSFVASDEAGSKVTGWLSQHGDKVLALASAVRPYGIPAYDNSAIPRA
jgi:phosphopantetheinyl transferase